jgi:hypothetical protein
MAANSGFTTAGCYPRGRLGLVPSDVDWGSTGAPGKITEAKESVVVFPGRAIFDGFVVVHVAAYDSFRCWRQSFTPQEDADRLSIPVPPLPHFAVLLLQLRNLPSLDRHHARDVTLTNVGRNNHLCRAQDDVRLPKRSPPRPGGDGTPDPLSELVRALGPASTSATRAVSRIFPRN